MEHFKKHQISDEDWRLRGQESYLSGVTLYRVSFPEFWKVAYRDKNKFYQQIDRYAKKFVAEFNRGHESLEGEKIQHFWHEHCAFCWDKATTDSACEFYCTEDMYYWICAECFKDFVEQFHWQAKPVADLFGQPDKSGERFF